MKTLCLHILYSPVILFLSIPINTIQFFINLYSCDKHQPSIDYCSKFQISKESLDTLRKSLESYILFMNNNKKDPTEASVKTLNKYLFKKMGVIKDI